MTTVFTTLKPYIKAAVAQNAKSGLPVMRPLFLHYEDDARAYTLKYQYLFGRDLLVAPVHERDAATGRSICRRTLVNAWTGETCRGGDITVDAPLGKPPVFYRQQSEWADLFSTLRHI